MRTDESGKYDVQFELADGGAIARRETKFLPDGSYLFEDELEVHGVLDAAVITCAGWLLELLDLEAGEMFFTKGEEQIRPNTKRFGIFYPPFTITRPFCRDGKAHLTGIAGTSDLPAKFLRVPFIFETGFAGVPTGAAQVVEILASSRHHQSIESNPKASLLSLKAKRLIDENYLIYPSISRIAARLNVSHEHLTRQFKRDFGMSPNAYLHQIRIADATFRLANGEEIINVSQDVGYNDLSRFYKQFRKSTTKTPGYCQTTVKPKHA